MLRKNSAIHFITSEKLSLTPTPSMILQVVSVIKLFETKKRAKINLARFRLFRRFRRLGRGCGRAARVVSWGC
jgi:hypothetical protein